VFLIAFAGLALASLMRGLAQEDRTAKLKPPEIVAKAISETLNQDGFTFSTGFSARGQSISYTGTANKPDVALLKCTEPAFKVCMRKEASAIVTEDGKVKGIAELGEKEHLLLLITRNPYTVLWMLREVTANCTASADQKVGEKVYKVIEWNCGESKARQQFREFVLRIHLPTDPKDVNFENFIDFKKTVSKFTVFVSKDDLLIRRVVWEFTPVLAEGRTTSGRGGRWGGGAVPVEVGQLSAGLTLDIEKYNDGTKLDFPKEIKRRLGMK
jgi:hypothetical protein